MPEQETQPAEQIDVPMLLAQLEVLERINAGLRNDCAALICEVKMLRRAVESAAPAAAQAVRDLANADAAGTAPAGPA